MIDVSELLSDPDFTQSITLRMVSATMGDGEERTTYVDSSIVACVQPATANQIQALPEGSRLKNIIAVYSTTEVRCSAQAQDIVVYRGGEYRAVKSEPWPDSNAFVSYCEGLQP